jgi:tetratricopeptide (TPR) repeat protein
MNIKKATLTGCLFLLAFVSVKSQDWKFGENTQKAYDLALNLQTAAARDLITDPKTAEEYYVLSLSETIELLITEDLEKFHQFEKHFLERIDKKIKGPDIQYQFLHAEMQLQWAFIYLKFGHELDAALKLRQAFQSADECRRKNPKFIPIRKTTGLLEIIIGSVPEKYNWVLGVMGMEGAIPAGLKDLEMVRNSQSSVAYEGDLLFSLVQGFIFQKPGEGLAEIQRLLEKRPHDGLLSFLGASLAIKNSQSEVALNLLDTLASKHPGIHLYYADYLRGEVYLHKAEYINAIASYRWFISHYKGQNYIKDAYYKIGICYWMNGNTNDAMAVFKEAKNKGKDATEADKHAARSLSDPILPHVLLSKVRYFTDGGYYSEASVILETISPADIPEKRDQVEYYYRKSRLAHKQNQIPAAKLFYRQVIDMAGDESWYFAPNACLQLGFIAVAEGNTNEARSYFKHALAYNRHEYKNSIDSKAKSALAQIERK